MYSYKATFEMFIQIRHSPQELLVKHLKIIPILYPCWRANTLTEYAYLSHS